MFGKELNLRAQRIALQIDFSIASAFINAIDPRSIIFHAIYP